MKTKIFENIIGQKKVLHLLENTIRNNKIGHAYIFTGPKGIGKRTIAGGFARGLLCSDPDSSFVCGSCKACRLVENKSSPDIYIIDADGKKIGIDEIRAIQEHIIKKPLYSKRKAYLIFDSDKMTVQAQNALLKTLEDPPGYAVIIMTAASYEALKETIRSRAVRLALTRNSNEEVKAFIESAVGNTCDTGFITAYSDGIIGRALELAQSEKVQCLRDEVLEIIINPDHTHFEYLEQNKENIGQILDMFILFYRDILLLLMNCPESKLINSDKKDIIFNNINKYSVKRVIDLIKTVEQTRKKLEFNTNYQLTLEVLLMNIQEDK